MAVAGNGGSRWVGRPWLSRALRLVVFVGPLLVAIVASWWLGRQLDPPTDVSTAILRFVLLSVVATAVLLAVDRLARRLLPLAAMLKLSLAFPERAPSRFKIARASASTRMLQAEVEQARLHGISDDRTEAAESILSLVAALSIHDMATRGHAERTRVFTDMIAEELELSQHDVDRLRWASLVHDVGKVTVHPDLLNKPGKPSANEWVVLREHPAEGARLTAPLNEWLGKWSTTIGQHHERWDGSGYPAGLAGNQISLGARIVAVADAYEVMTAARSYKEAKTAVEAREELARCAGDHFDPMVVRAFLAISLERVRWVLGPLSWMVHVPVLRPLTRLPSVAVTGAAATAAAASIVLATPYEVPVADQLPVVVAEDASAATEMPGPGNRAPVPGRVVASTTVGVRVAMDVLAVAVDLDDDPLVVLSSSVATGGTRVRDDGLVVYTPPPDWVGTATLTFVISDGEHDVTGIATIFVEPEEPEASPSPGPSPTAAVPSEPSDEPTGGNEPPVVPSPSPSPSPDPSNSAPKATADSYSTPYGQRLVTPAAGVLRNDRDSEGDSLRVVTSATKPPPASQATLSLKSDGSFVLTPASGFSGVTRFTYTISDGQRRDTATVTVTVAAPTSTSTRVYMTPSSVNSTTLRMSTTAPASSGRDIPDWDDDDEPGWTVKDSSQDEDEDDPEKFQDWLWSVPADLQLDGTVSLTLTSAVANLEGGKDVDYTVFLYSCDSDGRRCATLAKRVDKHVDDWNDEGSYTNRTFTIGKVSTTIPAGRTLRLKLLFDHKDVWLPLTGNRASALNLPALS